MVRGDLYLELVRLYCINHEEMRSCKEEVGGILNFKKGRGICCVVLV